MKMKTKEVCITFRVSLNIGCGQFGDLHAGIWTSSGVEYEVAIEALPSDNPDSKVKFLQEATIMAQLNHPNVIKLLGIVTDDKPVGSDPMLVGPE